MNIDKNKYKSLNMLNDGVKIPIMEARMQKWMQESSTNNDGDATHIFLLNNCFVKLRSEMRKNTCVVSDSIISLAGKNYERMLGVLINDWIKPQVGAMLMKDGSLFTYYIESISEEAQKDFPEEECIGIAMLCHFDKKGEMLNCAFVSSRRDYEGDNNRMLMYDSAYPTMVTATEFSPLLVTLAFMQYADIEVVNVNNGKKKNVGGEVIVNSTGYDVRYVDSRWLREIIRTEGFKVSGHFRLQPKKVDGEWTKRLIYINEYQKHGYHRRAGRDIANEKNI